MAQRHHDTSLDRGTSTAGDALSTYLHAEAMDFLRALAPRAETGRPDNGAETARLLCRSARRIGAALHTYAPLAEPVWAETVRGELGWLSTVLALEHRYAARLARLLDALGRLAATEPPEAALVRVGTDLTARIDEGTAGPVRGPRVTTTKGEGPMTIGAARAGALLDRQLTLARTRAHSTALQALGSSRFHALADTVAVLASDVPLTPAAHAPADRVLTPLADEAHRRLTESVAALPLGRAGNPYNADALRASLSSDPAIDNQDTTWHRVRSLLRLSRYAREVVPYPHETDRLLTAGLVLERHRDAAEAAAAVAAAARTPRIAPASAYALGVLHADQRHEVEAARLAFSRLWR